MKGNKVLIAVENPLLQKKLNGFFKQSGFNIISSEILQDATVKREISFSIVDISAALKLLPYILEQKEHSENILPALIFLPETENPVEWLEKGFDDFLFFKESPELYFAKIKKWVLVHQKSINALTSHQNLLNTVAHSLRSPIIIINKDGSIAAINQVAVELFGIDMKKTLGNHWTLYTPEEYIEQLLKVYENINNGSANGPHNFEFKFKDKLNRERTWKVSIDTDPVSENIVVVMQDIEFVKESQRAYYQSEQKFLSVIEAIDVAFSITTLEGVFVDVNRFFLDRLEYQRNEVIGKKVADLQIWHNLSERDKYISLLMKEGVVKEMKVDFKAKSGSLIRGILSGRIVSLNNKKYIFSSVKDVTELKNIQLLSRTIQQIKDIALTQPDENKLFQLLNNEFQYFSWFNQWKFLVFNKKENAIYRFQNNKLTKCTNCQDDERLLEKVGNNNSEIALNRPDIELLLGKKSKNNKLKSPLVWMCFPLRTKSNYLGSLVFKSTLSNQAQIKSVFNTITTITREISFVLEENEVEDELHIIRHALNSAASAVVITDTDGNITWVNKAFTSLTGYVYEEAIGQNPRILKSGNHPRSFYKKLWDTILAGKVWKNDLINKRKDGSFYHEENIITPVFNKNGKIIRFIAIKQDISERKKFEEDLKKHLNRHQILNNILSYYLTEGAVNLNSIINYYLAEIGTYVKADRMCFTEYDTDSMDWTNIYQWSKDTDERNILSNFNEDQIELLKDWFTKKLDKSSNYCSFSPNQIENVEIKNLFVNKNIGTLICFPLYHDEKMIGFIGFIFSDSDYIMADDELNLIEIFSYIIINIWLRNASLKELESAKQKAEEAVKLKTSFLANMNHEIRTPMNAVMGFSDLMTEASCEEKNEYAKIVLKSAKQLLKLINDVIFLSRLQSEHLPITLSECKPAELIDTVFQMFLVSDENVNNLDIRMSFPGSLKDFVFISDVDKIQQVMTNFVSNALKYTFSGYVEMGFSVEGDKVRFYVKDTGKGIAKEEVPKIFDAFYRSSDVMFSAIRGTGLGLNIAKELVETIEGEIGVNTELNKGSEFYFVLPYKKVENIKSSKKTKQPANQQWDELKILIAEDDEDSYLYLKTLLQKRVKTIDRATDGLMAIKMALDNEYDLILMDIKMPEVNGLDATRHIKLKKPHSIIIAQTAYAMPEEKKSALQLGCDEYITKPINKELLYDIIEKKVLSRK